MEGRSTDVRAPLPEDGEPAATPAARGLARHLPGIGLLTRYRRAWLPKDLAAGLALCAILVPVGMGYAEASGLPAIHGLYATIVPLVAYALFGPSRIMVLGPDSTLAAVIAVLILPMAGGSVERAIALAGALALLSGACSLAIGLAGLGQAADLLSKPIRIGFMNAIALTVLVGQLPKLLGFRVDADTLPAQVVDIAAGIGAGRTNLAALALGLASLAVILLLRRYRQRWPGVLIAVAAATAVSAALDLAHTAQVAVVGVLPQGLPAFALPAVGAADLWRLLPGAVIIAMLSFADTSVLSRALAQRGRYPVSQNQEMIALGAANLATGLFQGFSISSSNSRTLVAEAAGARTQMSGLIGALAIVVLLVAAPGLLASLPGAVLGAVVIAACLSFADVAGMRQLLRQRRSEFALSVASFVGVALIGVIEGIVIAIGLSMLILVWNVWHPHFAVLVRLAGAKGYHDLGRHPEGRRIPGLVLFRWDAQLFFANAEIFRDAVLAAAAAAPTPTRQVVIVADAIADIDLTAADALIALHEDLARQGIALRFAGLKGQVRDRLARYGTLATLGTDVFAPTVGRAVALYRAAYGVDAGAP
ncbi:MAG: SulP family inorganic anion transporter [Burkholderiales bacterium]|nr:SulP family inorganic anion transporter [Burkholderiales bacterium]